MHRLLHARWARGFAALSVAVVGLNTNKSAQTKQSDKPAGKERCVVIGAGIVGLTTAYFLSLSGVREIHVVDKHAECSMGASFQNGGVINVESIFPVNSYLKIGSTMRNSLMSTLTGSTTNTVITWQAFFEQLLEQTRLEWIYMFAMTPGLLRWLYYFNLNQPEDMVKKNSLAMMQIGASTGPLFEQVAKDVKLDRDNSNFSHTPGLCLFHVDDPAAFIKARKEKYDNVHKKQYISGEELQAVMAETGLAGLSECAYNVGVVEPKNMTINTRSFCKKLQDTLMTRGVKFHFCSTVDRISVEDDRCTGVLLNDGREVDAESVVVCAGYESIYLMHGIGVCLPLAPIKAYSLHISNAKVAGQLQYATHLEAGTACLVTPYRDAVPASVRVTGVRDLDGYNDIVRKERVSALMHSARTFVGDDFDEFEDVKVWAGVMAVSPDDLPIVGTSKRYKNLYMNTGHGFRGTNYSLTSAKLLSEVMDGADVTCIDKLAATPERFGI